MKEKKDWALARWLTDSSDQHKDHLTQRNIADGILQEKYIKHKMYRLLTHIRLQLFNQSEQAINTPPMSYMKINSNQYFLKIADSQYGIFSKYLIIVCQVGETPRHVDFIRVSVLSQTNSEREINFNTTPYDKVPAKLEQENSNYQEELCRMKNDMEKMKAKEIQMEQELADTLTR